MNMNIFEIVGGAVMILISIAACLLVLLQEGTKGGGISALSGGGDSFFNKNSGRTREALLFRGTKICVIILFVITVAVYAADILANRAA